MQVEHTHPAPEMELVPASDVYTFASAPAPTVMDDTSVSLRRALDKVLYKSQWAVATRWLDEHQLLGTEGEESLTALLQAGAKAFGLDWALSPTTLAPILAATRDDGAGFEAAQAALVALVWPPSISGDSTPFVAGSSPTTMQSASRGGEPTSAASRRRRRKRMVALAVVTITLLLAALGKLLILALIEAFPDFWAPLNSLFGPAIIVARVTAFGTLLCTAVLFVTMSRSLHRGVHGCCTRSCARSRVLRVLADSSKEIHVFSAAAMVVLALIHTVAQVAWDIPTMLTTDVSRLNAALKCGICDGDAFCRFTLPRALEWPPCPFHAVPTLSQLLGSTTVVTGLLLWLVLLTMWATAHRAARAARYDTFWLVHNGCWVCWVVLLWLHASNQWVGAAFPFALWIVVPPATVYYSGRVWRAWRVLVTATHEQPPTVVFQAVPEDVVDEAPGSHEALLPLPFARPGELMRLTLPVSRQFAAKCQSGMYALLCVPELSSWQWHPFTIASFDGVATASFDGISIASFDGISIASFDGVAGGTAAATTTPSTNACASTTHAAIDAEARRHLVEPSPSPRVSFIVEVAGDWTALLVSACKQAHLRRGRNAMPRVVLDGPFPAPAQAAPRCPVLLAVGAGIGITPFLSLIETLAERELAAAAGHLSSELLEARCYWITRSAEAFLFGWPLLRKLLANAQLRTRIVFHLHVTARAPEGDGAAFLFREAVARQNARLPKGGCPEAKADELFVAVDDVGGGGGGETAPAGVRIQFGRPDFQNQLLTLAARHPTYDVNVFACGGEALVESLAAACEASERAMRDSTQQRFPLAHERFG